MIDPIEPFAAGRHALLAASLDQSQECIALLDAGGRILFVNQAGARVMAASTPDALTGRMWAEYWPDETCTPAAAARISIARAGPDGARRWWEVAITPVDAGFLVLARDITAETIERERIAAIGAEMRHRLRNAMTTAAGIVMIAARSHPESRAFARDVGERLARIAAVQDVLLDPARDKSLAEIVPLLASAYGDGKAIRFGALPDVSLGDHAMQALALTFGELATNSLKYGALKNGDPIGIEGAAEGDRLYLTWREPTLFGASRQGGQGLELIDRIIRASNGTATYERADDQLTVRVSFPIAGEVSG